MSGVVTCVGRHMQPKSSQHVIIIIIPTDQKVVIIGSFEVYA